MLKKLTMVMAAASLVVACNKNRVEVIENVKIQIHNHDDKAKKLKDGDIITFTAKIYNSADSLLQESTEANPARAMVQPAGASGFKGSFEDGLRLLAQGDSATIYVPVDSLSKGAQQLPPFIKKGTDLKYSVKILKVQTRADFDKEMAANAQKEKQAAEARKTELPKLIQDYIAKSGKTFKTTASGLYYSITTEGTGASPKKGDVCKCMYVGKFLDGKVFDQSKQPIDMPIGQMIPGFNEALTLMKKGGKATFVIPPAIGYGEQGQGPIPGNSALVFEVEVIDFTASK
ncbi:MULTISPECIES: FKBP-type peptidyl-prolyl cis-trans isomerase [Bacteroidota]|jgi:FKBP-type peptidyl-prolyl cis-trans isomerase|uniref:Peptidyl-prolyl cis-trans isomerase n=1 Tax=Flectobacillus rivi TaxID=2984209 RepID=A0ABT6Z482_9BACT|nr:MULTISPECIES: FKBP-type peptidyl-prolyl cis-trans isomerase [Bacteroidota]MDI9875909.1 FKBP-type peptidyl-prolyl cis-trans isomerase [Flectobacillus rivi]MDI9879411.1 FKBP-type peptidyl-prolyl cis-trans isomerase [Flectobacillus longus]NBB27729.1 peptidylprolyl isomerase [Cellulophaga sp. BC115SP]